MIERLDPKKTKLANDFMFKSVFSDEERCRRLLELVLQIDIKHISFLASERVLKFYEKARGAGLDIRATLPDGTLIDVEMQQRVSTSVALPRKARFYHDMLDIDGTSEGTHLSEMRDSYVIFFCSADPFDQGRARYTFRNRCDEDFGLALKDGQIKIFINLHGDMSAESRSFAKFCQYLSGNEDIIDDDFVRMVHQAVVRLRGSSDWRHELMFIKDIVDDYWAENKEELEAAARAEGLEKGREKGREEGREEGLLIAARGLMASSSLTPREAVSRLGLAEADAERVLARLEADR